MLVFSVKPGHDGSIAVLRDRRLLYLLESEKDSFERHAALTPSTLLAICELVDDVPDVVALGGWKQQGTMRARPIGAGYSGAEALEQRPARFLGKPVRYFTSSHERSHLMMALGMAPRQDAPLRTVLVWEGATGALYLVDSDLRIVRRIPVLSQPGARYALLFALADPTFPDQDWFPRLNDAGKLMALAAFAEADDSNEPIARTVAQILSAETVYPAPKAAFRDSPVYNAGVEAPATKAAAALLTRALFERFAQAAVRELPAGTPLHISGGCGLNCEWNAAWRELGHFSSVFVPPCTNDSGSALGTAIDALAAETGDPYVEWTVYSGLEFTADVQPDPARWSARPLDADALAAAIGTPGRVAAWVQGRWEIGPRALGHRSLLAEPFHAETRDRLNAIKQREVYRPIAPCCRIEDVDAAFHGGFADPHMLYFRKVRDARLGAVTHVDGSARVQTVERDDNQQLHDLLTAFSRLHGVGVLCNTSLNFKGLGFINRMSDLIRFCESRGITDMVIGQRWFERRTEAAA